MITININFLLISFDDINLYRNIVNCIDYNYYSRVGGEHGCMYEGSGCFEIFRYELNWEYLKDLTKLNTL